MSKVIGIFAPVGSGKSLVLDILKNEYNAYIIQADKLAHELYKEDTDLKNKMISLFDENILDEDSNIDRQKLGQILYNNKELLKKVNEIVHPKVWDKICYLIDRYKKEYKLIAVEAALLPKDIGIYDEIWYIDVNDENRYKRLSESRNYSNEKIKSILDNQENKENYLKIATEVIHNNKTKKELKEQIHSSLNSNEIL